MKISNILVYILLAGTFVAGCKPKDGKEKELPTPSSADFQIIQYVDPADLSDSNTFIFRNITDGGFLSSWDFGGVASSRKSEDTVFFGFEGTYPIKLTTASKGGLSTVTKNLVVKKRSPYAAQFTMVQNGYNVTLNETSLGSTKRVFRFENGDSSVDQSTSVYTPFQGWFTITVEVTTPKGKSSAKDSVFVAADDMSNPALTDPIFVNLTGGLNDADGKTWIMDPTPNKSGVGPYNVVETKPSWWSQPDGYGGDTWTDGMLANEFTFKMRDYQYIPKNQKVTAHWAYANKYFGKSQAQYADIQLVDPNHRQTPFLLKNSNTGFGTGYTLDFTGGSYLGYFDYRYRHEIIKLTADSLYIRHKYDDNPANDPANDGGVRYFLFYAKP